MFIYLFIYLFAQAHTLRTIRQGLKQDSKAETCTNRYPKITENPTKYNYIRVCVFYGLPVCIRVFHFVIKSKQTAMIERAGDYKLAVE